MIPRDLIAKYWPEFSDKGGEATDAEVSDAVPDASELDDVGHIPGEDPGLSSPDDAMPTPPNATVTNAAGVTVIDGDVSIDFENNLEGEADGINEVSAGLASGELHHEIQFTIDTPTKTLECPECGCENDVPVFQFAHVEFSDDLLHMSGDYAIGFQCDRCGFPH